MENRVSSRLMEAILKEEDKQYRNFGFFFAGTLAVVFGFILPYLLEYSRPNWPFYAASGLIVSGLFAPKLLVFVQTPWMKFASILGKINGCIILALVFFGLITPYAIFLKLFNREPLKIKYDEAKNSYWSETKVNGKSKMDNPY